MINDSGFNRGIVQLLVFLVLGALVASVYGHNVSKEDIAALSVLPGVQVVHYMWLGAKHMVTGYDHLLFLLGVIYYIKQFNDVFVLVKKTILFRTVMAPTMTTKNNTPDIRTSTRVNPYCLEESDIMGEEEKNIFCYFFV